MIKAIKIIYPLAVIAVAVGLILSLAYQLLEPRLKLTAYLEETAALKDIFPGADSFASITNQEAIYYIAQDSNTNKTGYIFKEAQTGYGGPVEALIGITNGAVVKITVVNMRNETPGLGTKAGEESWLSQFTNITADKVPVKKSDFGTNGLDAISGATLTTLAVTRDIAKAFDDYRAVVGTNITSNK